MAEQSPTATEIIDVHAHIYPEGSLTEVVKDRPDFKLVENSRGQSLLHRGSHVMSMPGNQTDLKSRLGSMRDAGIGRAVLSVGALNIGWAGLREAPAARFAQALERMAADGGFEVLIHQGPADGNAVNALLRGLTIPTQLLLEPSLTELAGALALAQAYLGSDSGVSHLAASVGTPSVILYPPETIRQWAPWAPSAVALGVGSEGDLS